MSAWSSFVCVLLPLNCVFAAVERTSGNCTDGDVKLEDGAYDYEGRVEICYNGIWGTVCGDGVTDNTAIVVCNQLGLSLHSPKVMIQYAGGKGPIFLDEVRCSGNETSLLQCNHNGIGQHNCYHLDDMGVSCDVSRPKGAGYPFPDRRDASSEGDLRLLQDPSQCEGHLQVLVTINGQLEWTSACDRHFGEEEIQVACRQLECPAGNVQRRTVESYGGRLPSGSAYQAFGFSCEGSEGKVVDCPYTGAVCDLRQNSDIIAVACLEGGSEPANTTLTAPGTLSEGYRLRLAGGFDRCQGDLEVFIPFLQDWALAVSKEFGMDEAAVTCSELGCGMSFRITTSLRKSGPYLEVGYECDGTESRLQDCAPIPLFSRSSAYYLALQCQLDDDSTSMPSTNTMPSQVCIDFDVRLVGGNTLSDGRVDVCVEEKWVSVCGEMWGDRHAAVVCRQLGYNGISSADYGGMSQVFIEISSCIGNETRLADCIPPHSGVGLEYPLCESNITAVAICSNSFGSNDGSAVSIAEIVGSVTGVLLFVVIVIVMLGIIYLIHKVRKKRLLKMEEAQRDIGAWPVNAEVNRVSIKPVQINPYSLGGLSLSVNDEAYRTRINSQHLRELSHGKFLIKHDQISQLDIIGQGEYGVVYRARMGYRGKYGTNVAVKTLKGTFDQVEVDKFVEESLKMSCFKHMHVMDLIGVCLDAGPAPYIVMPYMANGSLLQYLRKERENLVIPEHVDNDEVQDVRKRLMVMCSQIASGMEYLAKEKYIHRDLAARNCMIDSHFLIKISDFGLTEDIFLRNYFREGLTGEGVKLPVKWMAPESLSDGHFSEKSDVWSYGVTMWEVFSGGKAPYPGSDILTLVKCLEKGDRMPKPYNATCTDEIYLMMRVCWDIVPDNRPSFKEIYTNTSNYIERIAGYLEIGFNPFSGENVERNCSAEPIVMI